jgi:arylsulfatase A
MADDMGHECLRSYGGTSYEPNQLDELASRGMRFTQCYSQPVCTPSRNKIMTGRSNARNYRKFGLLDPNEITFGNVLQRAGYQTCIAGKWQLSGGRNGGGTTPEKCGFDHSCMWAYVHSLPPGVDHTGGWEKPGKPTRYWHPSIIQNGNYRPTTIDDYGPDIFTQFILDFMEENRRKPFFVYYPMALTHGPFQPTPNSEDLSSADKFGTDVKYMRDMVSYAAHCVDRIVRNLEDLGLAEDTLVLFTTDNGSHASILSHLGSRPIPGGKGVPVDAGCHAPLIAYWQGTIAPGSTCTDLVDFSDFLPTIAALTNAKLPTDRPLDGRSFLPQLLGERGNPRNSIFMHYDKDPQKEQPNFRRVRFALDGRFKLYHDGKMFDVRHDVEEEHPLELAALNAEQQSTLNELQTALDAMPHWTPDNSVFGDGPDKATRRRLEQLRQLRALD